MERRQVLKLVGGAGVGLVTTGAVAGSTAPTDTGTARVWGPPVPASPAAGTGECGVDAVWQEEWRDIAEGGQQVHNLDRQTDFPCPVSVEFDTGPLDLDAYLTLDGRTPTEEDYDRYTDAPMAEGFTVAGDLLDPGDELGLLVVGVDVPEDTGRPDSDEPEPPGDYLTILTESTDEVVEPVANLSVLTDEPTEGESVAFDGSESFARLGSLDSYGWSYERSLGGDSGSGTGETFSFVPADDGQYRVTLEVVDEFGRSATAEESLSVDSDGGFCFITTATADEKPTLDSLRRFRDDSMAATPVGRGLVGLYYRISPPLARAMDRHPEGRTARLCRWYVRRCAALSDSTRETDSRLASAGLGVLVTVIYVVGLLVAALGYAGIRISERLA